MWCAFSVYYWQCVAKCLDDLAAHLETNRVEGNGKETKDERTSKTDLATSFQITVIFLDWHFEFKANHQIEAAVAKQRHTFTQKFTYSSELRRDWTCAYTICPKISMERCNASSIRHLSHIRTMITIACAFNLIWFQHFIQIV